MTTANIFEIKRFAVHDGDGIRTTVFFKGCPLKCVWCHNPEGISFRSEISYYENKCIGCAECADICSAHSVDSTGHTYDRSKCISCGKCVDACLSEALILHGRKVTVEDLLPTLLEDKSFYDTSGGGVTLSGGECLSQPEFCRELLIKLKENGIHTAVDTSGFVSREAIDKVIGYTDIFLYDIKAIDEDVHIKCTGHSNRIILENLRYIDSIGKSFEVRFPYVPGLNSNQTEKIAVFLKSLKNLTKIRVLAYHNYAGSKYTSLNMQNTLPTTLPSDEEIENAIEIFTKAGIKVQK